MFSPGSCEARFQLGRSTYLTPFKGCRPVRTSESPSNTLPISHIQLTSCGKRQPTDMAADRKALEPKPRPSSRIRKEPKSVSYPATGRVPRELIFPHGFAFPVHVSDVATFLAGPCSYYTQPGAIRRLPGARDTPSLHWYAKSINPTAWGPQFPTQS